MDILSFNSRILNVHVIFDNLIFIVLISIFITHLIPSHFNNHILILTKLLKSLHFNKSHSSFADLHRLHSRRCQSVSNSTNLHRRSNKTLQRAKNWRITAAHFCDWR